MTCFVNAVFCKVAEVISTIPHTNITVTFRIFIFVNMEYIFVENQVSIYEQFKVQMKRRSYRYCTRRPKTNAYI